MENTPEELNNIKEKLISHIEKTYSPEQSNDLKSKINKMNNVEFVEFLKKQGLLKGEGENRNCVFCSMVKGEIPTTKVGENNGAIAILEINPVSEGHSLIIPKEHIKGAAKFPEDGKKLAEQIAKDLKNALHPQRVEFAMSNIMGHEAMNVIPVYSNENMDSERKSETPEGLKKTKERIENSKIKTVETPKPIQINEEEKENANEINEKNTWLPKRMKP